MKPKLDPGKNIQHKGCCPCLKGQNHDNISPKEISLQPKLFGKIMQFEYKFISIIRFQYLLMHQSYIPASTDLMGKITTHFDLG